jgi:hypothetical protein
VGQVLASPSPHLCCRQITKSDLNGVANLLARGFRRRGVKYWLKALERLSGHSTPPGLPRYGYLLENDGSPVGVLLLIFSTVGTGSSSILRCNVSSWYADPAFRTYASLLVQQAIKNKNACYINISPAPHVLPTIKAQGFSRYSNGQFLAIPVLGRNATSDHVTLSRSYIEPTALFEPYERALLLEHAGYGCLSLWCTTSERAYPFVFLPRLVKRFIPCVQLVYCRDVADFVRFARPIGSFLTLRGWPFVLIDSNGPIPGLMGRYFEGVAPKYFKGPERPRLGDLAYTEAAMFGM